MPSHLSPGVVIIVAILGWRMEETSPSERHWRGALGDVGLRKAARSILHYLFRMRLERAFLPAHKGSGVRERHLLLPSHVRPSLVRVCVIDMLPPPPTRAEVEKLPRRGAAAELESEG